MKNRKDEGGRAFPSDREFPSDPVMRGLTRREWFAGQALAGILANPELTKQWNPDHLRFNAVEMAFDIADGCLPPPDED